MDIFAVVRLLVGNRQIVVLAAFAVLLETDAVSFPPLKISLLGWALAIDEGHILGFTLVAIIAYCVAALAKIAKHWLDERRLISALKSHLKHNSAIVFSFNTEGVHQAAQGVGRPHTWHKVISPSAELDETYDKKAKNAANLLDQLCFGSGEGQDFSFAGEGKNTASLWLASIVRKSHAKEETSGLSGFGLIENRRQNGQSSRFAVAIDERVANSDIDRSWISILQTDAVITVTLRQFVNISGPERYFNVHLLLPFVRKSLFARWHLKPILMFIDSPYRSQGKILFRGHEKILLGYGGRLDVDQT